MVVIVIFRWISLSNTGLFFVMWISSPGEMGNEIWPSQLTSWVPPLSGDTIAWYDAFHPLPVGGLKECAGIIGVEWNGICFDDRIGDRRLKASRRLNRSVLRRSNLIRTPWEGEAVIDIHFKLDHVRNLTWVKCNGFIKCSSIVTFIWPWRCISVSSRNRSSFRNSPLLHREWGWKPGFRSVKKS